MRRMRALAAIALLGLALPVAAQQVTVASPAAERLRVTTTSDEASRHFFAGVSDARNIFFSRAAMHFDRALEIDRNVGLARAFRAAIVPGLTEAERTAAIDSAIATMTSATTAERVVALAIREFPTRARAHALWETAVTLLPGDPTAAFYAALTTPAPGAVAAMRAVTERFPEDAAGYNILAYDKEGTEIAQWLNSIGVTGVVLKYRVPARKDRERHAARSRKQRNALRHLVFEDQKVFWVQSGPGIPVLVLDADI